MPLLQDLISKEHHALHNIAGFPPNSHTTHSLLRSSTLVHPVIRSLRPSCLAARIRFAEETAPRYKDHVRERIEASIAYGPLDQQKVALSIADMLGPTRLSALAAGTLTPLCGTCYKRISRRLAQ